MQTCHRGQDRQASQEHQRPEQGDYPFSDTTPGDAMVEDELTRKSLLGVKRPKRAPQSRPVQTPKVPVVGDLARHTPRLLGGPIEQAFGKRETGVSRSGGTYSAVEVRYRLAV